MIVRRTSPRDGLSSSSSPPASSHRKTTIMAESPHHNVRKRRRTLLWRILIPVVALLGNGFLASHTLQRVWPLVPGGKEEPTGTSLFLYQTPRNLHQKLPPAHVEIEDLSELIQSSTTGGHQSHYSLPTLHAWKTERGAGQHENKIPFAKRLGAASKPATTTATATQTNVSFCLLIKDDNDILNEWIAYHYHLWNLRRLIVAVDPSSGTSPRETLDRWHDEFGLRVEVWNDARYMPDFFLLGEYEKVPNMIKLQDRKNTTKWQDEQPPSAAAADLLQLKYRDINNHRFRQSKFLQHCAKVIQGTGVSSSETDYHPQASSWMTHIDTDEYMTLNPTLLVKPPPPQDSTGGEEEPSKEFAFPKVPTTLSSGSLLDFLEQVIRLDVRNSVNWPCISMPRVLYGAVEDPSSDSLRQDDHYLVWDTRRFETLRWKYHARFDNRELNKQPKVIMDAAGFPSFNVSRKAFSIHRPSLHLCRMQSQMNVDDGARYPLVVHHYLGSLERYQARQDPRRTATLYQQKANIRDAKDTSGWIDGWLPEFVKQHGMAKVSTVLWQYQTNGTAAAAAAAAANGVVSSSSSVEAAPIDPRKPLELGKLLPMNQDSLSACLLVKDDNQILNEWIAYHHHVLKLRTLIVAIDPSSQTSPARLLDRWRDWMDHIQLWTDNDYMPDFFLQGQFDLVPNLLGNMTNSTTSLYHNDSSVDEAQVKQDLLKINNHRFRQVSFLSSCVQTLKQQNKTWMIHIDSDEYVTLHPQVRTQNHWRKLPLDPTIRPNSIFDLLKRATAEFSKGMSYPCVSMPRLLYGSKEDTKDPGRFANLPSSFCGTKFETTRWKYYANYDVDVRLNGKPKAILDLSGLPPEAQLLKSKVYSIHRPGLHLCQSDRKILFEASHRFPLTINHYIGSWERYNHRNDARRNRAIYDEKASVHAGKDDDWIDGWVTSFVREHGLATAKHLLADYTADGSTTDLEQAVDDLEDGSPLQADQLGLGVNSSVAAVKNMTDMLKSFDSSQRMEFSACLLVKDDNDILNEWIAYHYHVLGLRYIIVAIDAKSRTSPSALLDQWRQFGLEIEEWTDEMFMPDIYFQKAYHLQPRLVKIKKNKHKWLEGIDDPEVKREYYNTIQDHRFRQITFLASCTRRLRDQGRTWMIHIDTDEYVAINPKLREKSMFAEKIHIPPTADAYIVPRLLNEMVLTSWETINYPCVSLPRLLYGSIEEPGDPTVPTGFNQSRFESLRWKYHTDFEDSELNKQPKVILDVSAIPANDKMFTENRVFSIHRPSQVLCRTQGQMLFEDTDLFPFSANHYLGTFERFGSRDDPRRNRKLYDQKASVRAGKDDDHWIDSWLPSFITAHGEEKVNQLLKDYRTQ